MVCHPDRDVCLDDNAHFPQEAIRPVGAMARLEKHTLTSTCPDSWRYPHPRIHRDLFLSRPSTGWLSVVLFGPTRGRAPLILPAPYVLASFISRGHRLKYLSIRLPCTREPLETADTDRRVIPFGPRIAFPWKISVHTYSPVEPRSPRGLNLQPTSPNLHGSILRPVRSPNYRLGRPGPSSGSHQTYYFVVHTSPDIEQRLMYMYLAAFASALDIARYP